MKIILVRFKPTPDLINTLANEIEELDLFISDLVFYPTNNLSKIEEDKCIRRLVSRTSGSITTEYYNIHHDVVFGA